MGTFRSFIFEYTVVETTPIAPSVRRQVNIGAHRFIVSKRHVNDGKHCAGGAPDRYNNDDDVGN
jgi:hypothetical protein